MNQEVLVGGTVTKTHEVNLVIAELGAYEIDECTGKKWVTTKTGLPAEGQTVGLKANVGSGFKLVGQTLGVVLREVERQAK